MLLLKSLALMFLIFGESEQMKVITEWKDLGISTVTGYTLQIVTTISSFNEDEIEELKQSLGSTYTIVNTESDKSECDSSKPKNYDDYVGYFRHCQTVSKAFP